MPFARRAGAAARDARNFHQRSGSLRVGGRCVDSAREQLYLLDVRRQGPRTDSHFNHASLTSIGGSGVRVNRGFLAVPGRSADFSYDFRAGSEDKVAASGQAGQSARAPLLSPLQRTQSVLARADHLIQ